MTVKNVAKPYVIACIPACNEEVGIAKVIVDVQEYVDKVIVVDDGSSDSTGRIAVRLGATVISNKSNKGYGSSLAELFSKAKELNPDVAVTLDADGQHNPSDIPKLVEEIMSGGDIAIASRFLSEDNHMPRYRKLGVKTITKLAQTSAYKEVTDAQSGFRAYSNRALQLIYPAEQGMGASVEILLKAKQYGLKVCEVPTKMTYEGKPSNQNPFYHGLDVATSMVKVVSMRRPLLFYGVPGFIIFIVGLAFWLWTLQIFTVSGAVVTSITLIALAATMVGLLLLITAVILWVLISAIRERNGGNA